MSINIDNNTIIWLILGIILFILGYVISFLRNSTMHSSGISQKMNKITNNKNNKLSISIDDSKYVTDIATDNLEKKYNNLGDIIQSSDNIESSISKLKNLKR